MDLSASTNLRPLKMVVVAVAAKKNQRCASTPTANTNVCAVLDTVAPILSKAAAVSHVQVGFCGSLVVIFSCIPTETYTYQLKLVLESMNRTMLHFDSNLKDEISPQYRSLASNARMGLKQALMSTDLSESVQDSQVMGIHPTSESELQSDGVLVDFFIHLAKQQDENELKSKLVKSLERNNYFLGESDITAARFTDSLQAQGKYHDIKLIVTVYNLSIYFLCQITDFDECSHEGHHDCSEFADCINEKGSYRCQCRPGFIDSSDEDGRICLGKYQISPLEISSEILWLFIFFSSHSRTPRLRRMQWSRTMRV